MMNFLSTIKLATAKIVISSALLVASFFGYHSQPTETVGSTLPVAGYTYTLSGSGISASASSITLTSFTLPQTGYEILDADMSSTFYLTIEPGNRTKQEIVSCTTVTQNSGDTATLSGCSRGLLPIYPYTASTTYAFAHSGASSVVFSNVPQFYNQYAALDMTESISGVWTFSSATPPKYDYNPDFNTLASTTLASTGFVASTSYAGTVNMSTTTKGIGEEATAAEIDAMVLAGATGAHLVMNPSAFGSTTLYANIPSTSQKAALAGASSTPSATNKYLTQAGVATTSYANSIVQASSTGKIDSSFFSSFGGTGVDGALSISSGTTTLDLASSTLFIKNYSSISITGTGVLNFSNPPNNGTIVILRSTGGCTITSSGSPSITVTGLGGQGGINTSTGVAGSSTISTIDGLTTHGGNGGSVATGGTAYSVTGLYTLSTSTLSTRSIILAGGAGGGGGSNGNATNGGIGGRGGGALYLECGGALNFTSTINANGQNGNAGVNGGPGSGGGGGGGAEGMVLILYGSLTANSGTINTSSGNGGIGGSASAGSATGGAGGGGGGFYATGGAGGAAGANGNNGSLGSGGGGGGGNAGGGQQSAGTGDSTARYFVGQNLFF